MRTILFSTIIIMAGRSFKIRQLAAVLFILSALAEVTSAAVNPRLIPPLARRKSLPLPAIKSNSSNPVVSMQVKRFYSSKNCDPGLPFGYAKCDPLFDITYSWTDPNGVVQSSRGYYDGGEDVNQIVFPPQVGHSALAVKGSLARVHIVATDEDVNFHDSIGTFDFTYSVPYQPTVPQVITAHDSTAEMVVEFSVRF
ncbi:uncharacterized protein LOC129581101 [Paramacrobiotus metropolitanus]|uniref:uncharacterized protein LOC129581101 n=1 Tax=Paramacrobiotus metropolitanus TaxID=2943436 RepID=UPI0024456D0B|nr:uncharacterized protein LOC129581101 [Paramacrobiotus metropolitanus]